MSAVGCLLIANVVVPLLGGDIYPFTSAPMFRDSPSQCCNYKVLAADGRELNLRDWRLERVYDGNPVGYGVGVRPPPILETQFGSVHDEATLRKHVERQFGEPVNQEHPFVDVIQEVIGPTGGQRLGVVRQQRWRIERPALMNR
jgi:hypothetical protein